MTSFTLAVATIVLAAIVQLLTSTPVPASASCNPPCKAGQECIPTPGKAGTTYECTPRKAERADLKAKWAALKAKRAARKAQKAGRKAKWAARKARKTARKAKWAGRKAKWAARKANKAARKARKTGRKARRAARKVRRAAQKANKAAQKAKKARKPKTAAQKAKIAARRAARRRHGRKHRRRHGRRHRRRHGRRHRKPKTAAQKAKIAARRAARKAKMVAQRKDQQANSAVLKPYTDALKEARKEWRNARRNARKLPKTRRLLAPNFHKLYRKAQDQAVKDALRAKYLSEQNKIMQESLFARLARKAALVKVKAAWKAYKDARQKLVPATVAKSG